MDHEKLNPYYEKPRKKFTITFDLRLVIVLLLLVIGGMLWFWKPWHKEPQADRTISITGQATVKAVPDEYVFYPYYQFKNADRKTAEDALNKKSEEVNAKLKEIGVSDSSIKSNTSNYGNNLYSTQTNNNNSKPLYVYTLQFTITVSDQNLAQKVQDYLTTTNSLGSVSPSAQFSESKKKQLQNQARDQATKDARSQADQTAKNLGFKIIGVKNVKDDQGLNNNYPYITNSTDDAAGIAKSSSSSLRLQPGENDLSYSVIVVYFIR